MKTLACYASLLAILLPATSCKKESDSKVFNGYFYAIKANSDNHELYLYIDGTRRGKLPVMVNPPTCDNDSLKKLALFISMKSGKYMMEARMESNESVAKANVEFSGNSCGAEGSLGMVSNLISGDCLITGLGE